MKATSKAKMNTLDPNQWLSQYANHQSPYSVHSFDGSMTTHTPQGLLPVGSSVGNHHYQPLSNESQLGLNYDKTRFITPNGFNGSFPCATDLNSSAAFSEPSGMVPRTSNHSNNPTAIMEAGKMNSISNLNTTSKMPLRRSPTRRSKIIGAHNRARHSTLGPRVKDLVIKKRATSGRSRLIEALGHLESAKDSLESYNDYLAIISNLEESILQHIMIDNCKSRATAGLSSRDVDSAYQSMSQVSATEETESLPTSFDFSLESLESQYCSSKATEDDHRGIDESVHRDTMMNTMMDMETPRPIQPRTTIYHCVFQKPGKTCEFSTKKKSDWIRHGESEEHFPQKRYMCILCIKPLVDEEGNPLCLFCFAPISVTSNNKQHYLQCQKARNGRHIFAGAREGRFKHHLKSQHRLAGIEAEQSTWAFDVQGDWPSECGFCGDQFSSWQDRINHIAAHFQEGVDISSWRLPFRKPKAPWHHRPSIDYQKWYDDDDDGDDDGDNHFGGSGRSRTPRSFFGSSGNSGLSQTSSSCYDSQGWPSFLDGNMFELRPWNYDSKVKVECYLKNQFGKENVECQTDYRCSDTGSESLEASLHHVPTEEHAKVMTNEDVEGNTKQSPTKPARMIDENNYDEDEDDEDGAQASPFKNKSIDAIPSPSKAASSLASFDVCPTKQSDQNVEDVSLEQPKSSEEARKQVEAKNATEETDKRSFHTLFYALENYWNTMLERQKLEESERQIDTEMANSDNANNGDAIGKHHGSLSSANWGSRCIVVLHGSGVFPLYPDPTQNTFLQKLLLKVQNFDIDNNLFHFARTQAPLPRSSRFISNTLYIEADLSAPSSYALKAPELRAGSSYNYPTTSVASAMYAVQSDPPWPLLWARSALPPSQKIDRHSPILLPVPGSSDLISVASGVPRLVFLAIQSSIELYKTIQSFQRLPEPVRDLNKSPVTAKDLEIYRDFVETTSDDLETYLQAIDEKLETIFGRTMPEPGTCVIERRYIKEERLSILKCLQICARLSDDINQIQLTPRRSGSSPELMDPDFSPESLAIKGLQETQNSLILTTLKLEEYMKNRIDRLITKSKTAGISEELTDYLRLLEDRETACQSSDICSRAGIQLEEHINTNSIQFIVSTDGDMIHCKSIGLGRRTMQVVGHLSDVSLQNLSQYYYRHRSIFVESASEA